MISIIMFLEAPTAGGGGGGGGVQLRYKLMRYIFVQCFQRKPFMQNKQHLEVGNRRERILPETSDNNIREECTCSRDPSLISTTDVKKSKAISYIGLS